MSKNGGNKETWALTFVLAAGLVLSSIGLAYVVESLSTAVSLQGMFSQLGSEKKQKATGYLEVRAALLTQSGNEEPISQLRTTVTGASPSAYNETFYTDSYGIFGVHVSSGEYLVECRDSRFALSVKLNVVDYKKTELKITVIKLSYHIPFYELYDRDSSGILSDWEQFFITIPYFGLTANYADRVIIEAFRITAGFQPEEIVARVLAADPRGDYVWFSLQPVREFSVRDISSFYLVSYQPSCEVQVSAV